MRLAILADIHGNLEALEAVLIAAERERAERIVCLGDVVGYGPDPVGCIYRLQEVAAVGILGNCDQAVLDPQHIRSLNPMVRDTLHAAREVLAEADLHFLQDCAFRRVEHGAVFAHANPIRPEEWEYLFMYDRILWCMERLDWQVCFVGHTHHAAIHCKMRSRVVPLTSTTVAIGPHQYLINPGSVGQPRDGDWRAAFALWDLERRFVELHRVEYPVQLTQKKVEKMGWSAYLAERLSCGE